MRAGWRAFYPLILTAAAVALWGSARSAAQQPPDPAAEFDRTEVMVPMRDGVKLHTLVYAPKGAAEALPFLFLRTPYGISGAASGFRDSLKELRDDGYIFVFQDIRGRYASEGSFVMLRPVRDSRDPQAIDEGTDTYDTIEWLLKNVPNHNGRVGMMGVSYPGWLTVMGTLEPHPALKAASPQASPADMWMGDDFHHNGAFRLSYGFEYAYSMESSKQNSVFGFDRHDTFDWYLSLGPLSNVNAKHLQGKIPTWNDYVEHPDYDAFWQRQAVAPYLKRVTVPTLNVAGWWDQEDFYGPLKIYETLEKHDSQGRNYLVVGPWNHGGWGRPDGNTLGSIDFGSPTARYYRERIQAPWFAFWLKGRGTPETPEATTFEAGTNRWRTWGSWPPKSQSSDRALYFHADERLSFEPPKENGKAYDEYVSDPANPVPYRQRPIEPTYGPGSRWPAWLLEDQRFVDDRPDVLSWETEPLEQDLTIAGDIIARLHASTSGGDCDWIVKLIDVYPEQYPQDRRLAGWQLMVANEVFRARYRRSFEKPEPVAPDRVTPYAIDLHSQSYTFRKGHRVMVQVQSTWFPVIDRNPQTWVPNIFKAKASDYRKATQRVYRSARYPSHVALPVVQRGAD